MRTLRGRTAVVTGAARGIGRALAERLGHEGCRLALVDRDEEGLAAVARALRARGCQATARGADVGDASQMEAVAAKVLSAHGAVHLLVNNAGVSLAGPFEAYSREDMEWIVGANLWGVLHGCRVFLPALRRAGEGHIVNVSSDFGLLGLPTKTLYSATKFAVRGFSEALRAELHGTGIGVTCVFPGPSDTSLVRGGRATDKAKQALEAAYLARRDIPVERVAARIVRAVRRNEARVVIGRETRLMDAMARLSPRLTGWLVARMWRRVPFL